MTMFSLSSTLFLSESEGSFDQVRSIAMALFAVGFALSSDTSPAIQRALGTNQTSLQSEGESMIEVQDSIDRTKEWMLKLVKKSADSSIDSVELFLSIDNPNQLESDNLPTIFLSLFYKPDTEDEFFLYQEFLAWVLMVAGISHPQYGWGGFDFGLFGYETTMVTSRSVQDLARQPIEWLNIFGEPYIQSIGRDRLLSAPAWRVEVVADGSIAIVLAPHPDAVTRETAVNVAKHCGVRIAKPGRMTDF